MKSGKELTIALEKRKLRGSRLRCLMLTSMPRQDVARTLTDLVAPFAVVHHDRDLWMPGGFKQPDEAKLGESACFLSPDRREQVTRWWLKIPQNANTPNWDIASTCSIEGEPGLILVEAKAHSREAKRDGKPSGNPENDAQIQAAITEANAGLNQILPGWNLCRDLHYQLCNRFAWTWKLATLGIPTILIYLGFLGATEMADQGQPFTSAQGWHDAVQKHAKGFVPETAWERQIETGGAPMWALIRSVDEQSITAGQAKGAGA